MGDIANTSKIVCPCGKCPKRDHREDPFCRKSCEMWQLYEGRKKAEEKERLRGYAAYEKTKVIKTQKMFEKLAKRKR